MIEVSRMQPKDGIDKQCKLFANSNDQPYEQKRVPQLGVEKISFVLLYLKQLAHNLKWLKDSHQTN